MISMLADSLKRLYDSEQISLDDIERLYTKGSITDEEYTYIVKEEEA